MTNRLSPAFLVALHLNDQLTRGIPLSDADARWIRHHGRPDLKTERAKMLATIDAADTAEVQELLAAKEAAKKQERRQRYLSRCRQSWQKAVEQRRRYMLVKWYDKYMLNIQEIQWVTGLSARQITARIKIQKANRLRRKQKQEALRNQ